jgi:hypothetical protein
MSFDLMAASKDELREYARNELGINLPSNASESTLREKVAVAMGVEVLNTAAPARAARKPKSVVINIHKTQGKLGRSDVFVSVNNRDYLIKRGVDVDVPAEVVHVLENAVEDVFEYDEARKDIVRREAHAYPFTVVR